MPETLEAPPAAAPASEPAAPAAPAAPGPRGLPPAAPSRFQSLEDALEAHATPDPSRTKPNKPEPKPGDKPPVEPKKPEPAAKPEDKAKPVETAPVKPAEKPGERFNPVKDLKVAKARIVELETKVKDMETARIPAEERATITKRMDEIQAENTQLRNRIRFKDYESSPEFKDKFLKPYEDSLIRAMEDVSRITITDQNGQTRLGTQQDVLNLANLLHTDLAAAKRFATETFGDFAPEVTVMANEVRKTLAAHNKALKDEETNGATREQQQKQREEQQTKHLTTEFIKLYTKANESFLNNPKDTEIKGLLTPKVSPEGQQLTPEETEHNATLERGYKLFDAWVGRHPAKAANAEEAAEIIKHHVAIRARNAGFGVLRKLNYALTVKLAKAEKELAAYQESAPTTGGRNLSPGAAKPAAKRSSLSEGLDESLGRLAGRRR
jgi:hypothetical protein